MRLSLRLPLSPVLAAFVFSALLLPPRSWANEPAAGGAAAHSEPHAQGYSHSAHSAAKPKRVHSSFDPKNPCSALWKQVNEGPVCVQASWTQAPKSPGVPPEGRMGQLELRFTQTGKPFPLAKLGSLPRVWLLMPEMDHGSMPVTLIPPPTEGENAHILGVKDLVFSMPGYWEIRLSLPQRRSAKKTEQISLPYLAE